MDEIFGPIDGPVMLRSELLAVGHSDRNLSRLVRAGVLQRVRRGAYVDGQAWAAAGADERHVLAARAVVKQGQTRLVVSHASALPLFGAPTWGFCLDHVHVTRPDLRCGRKERGVRQHRGVLLNADVTMRRGLEVTSGTKTALDVTRCAGMEASLIAINFLLRGGFTTLADLRERYVTMAHDPFTLKTDLVLRLADPRPESVGEVRTAYLLHRGGVPAPIPQYQLYDDRGELVARLDFAWPELRVWLEFDGREKYLTFLRDGETVVDAVLREKARESRIAEMTGWRCIRVTWADLERPRATVTRIVAMLGVATRAPMFT
jgi:hypothetical protein